MMNLTRDHRCTLLKQFLTLILMTNALLSAAALSLSLLAEIVADDGIAAHHDALVASVAASGVAERFPVLAHLVVDATAPPVARERALGRLAAVAGTKVGPPRTGSTFVWAPQAA